MIEVKPVEKSSLISGIGYSEEERILKIRFKKKGAEYVYPDFPPEEFAKFEKAASLGKHFHNKIRKYYRGTCVLQGE